MNPEDLMPDPELVKEQANLDRIYKNFERDTGAPVDAQTTDPKQPGFVRYQGEAPREGTRPLR